MKLFFVIDNNQPHASGGGYYAIFQFADFLARRGHEVMIYAVHDLGWVRCGGRLRVVYRPRISRGNRLLRKADKLLEWLCDRLLLPRLARRFGADWLLGVLKESAIKAVDLGRQLQRPVANFIYECPPWLREIYGEAAYRAADDGYTRQLWARTREAYLASAVLLPNSELSRQHNQAWLGGQPVAPPAFPGVDTAQMPFDGPAERSAGRHVLFVGRLVPEKNLPLLLDAWRRLPPDVVLHIAGSGPLLGWLQDQARDRPNLRVLGFVDDQRLWALFRGTDLLVCPSQFEGFGMPPMQALYFEKACLVSDLPIFRSLYGEHVDYFPTGDAQALADGVLRLLDDPARCGQMGRAGRQHVLQHFTWQAAAQGIEACLLAHEAVRPREAAR